MSVERRTILSPCRQYRYVLWREFTSEEVGPLFTPKSITRSVGYVMFIGLNPSTADETRNDPTIRKCIGFAKRWGYGALCMTNLFAYRATDPRKMMGCVKPVGDENDRYLAAYARDADRVVAAWGTKGVFLARDQDVMKLIDRVECLRKTKAGFPEHPLYVPYETVPVPYETPT